MRAVYNYIIYIIRDKVMCSRESRALWEP